MNLISIIISQSDYTSETEKTGHSSIEELYDWPYIESIAKEVNMMIPKPGKRGRPPAETNQSGNQETEMVKKGVKRTAQAHSLPEYTVRQMVSKAEGGPSNRYKVGLLKEMLYSKFSEHRQSLLFVNHDIFQTWINELKVELRIEKLNLSSVCFFNQWKKDKRVSFRHIMKIVSKSESVDQNKIAFEGLAFVEKVNRLIESYPGGLIWNTDQSPIAYEAVKKRTYSFRGEKDTLVAANSINSTKHTFTIQPAINRLGRISKRCLVVLQESSTDNGGFGPQVVERVKVLADKYKNLVITPSSSGLVHHKHIDVFATRVLHPHIGDSNALLIQDSLATQRRADHWSSMENLRIETIPPKCTGKHQPLDVSFNHPFKQLTNKIDNFLGNLKIQKPALDLPSPHEREFKLREVSLIWQQFKSPVYYPMLSYAWCKSGYSLAEDCEVYERFESTLECQLQLKKTVCEECKKEPTFVRCSHCVTEICLFCFILGDSMKHWHYETEDDYDENHKLDYESLGMVGVPKSTSKKRKLNSSNEQTKSDDQPSISDLSSSRTPN